MITKHLFARHTLTLLLLFTLISAGLLSVQAQGDDPILIPAAPATFNVNTTDDTTDADVNDGICADNSGNCSLRAAISQANFTDDEDTIVLPAGNYVLTRTGEEDNNISGDYDILKPLIIQGDGQETTYIDGGGTFERAFHIAPGVAGTSFQLSGVTIRNFDGPTCGQFFDDGIVFNGTTGSVLTLNNVSMNDNEHCVVSNTASATITNSSFYRNNGDDVISNFGVMTVNNTVLSSNTNVGDGTIASYGNSADITIRNVTVSDNSTTINTSSGIHIDSGTATIEDSLVIRNYSGLGGGMRIGDGTPNVTITRTTIAANEAEDGGGGIYADGGAATISDSLITDNSTSGWGGGIYNEYTTLTLQNTTITGNIAVGNAGGIYHYGPQFGNPGDTTLINVTITDNEAQRGGGYYVRDGSFDPVNIQNSIVAGNTATVLANDCFDATGSTTSGGNNIVGDDSDCNHFAATGDQPDTAPLLNSLANNGGPTCTHALQSGSPAINPAVVGTPTTTDQRGGAASGNRDIGAFEFGVTVADEGIVCEFGNETPVAFDDAYLTEFQTQLAVSTENGVLSNDTDADVGDTVTAILKTDVSSGTLTLDSDGAFTYLPNTGFVGTDTFTYVAYDEKAESNVATVTITVSEAPGENPPEAPQGLLVDVNQGRPTISWDFDPNAEWYHIWIGGENGQVLFDWFPRPGVSFDSDDFPTKVICDGIRCTLDPDINPVAGSYEVWMETWGFGSFSTGGPLPSAPSWNGPANFTLSSTPPGPVSAMTATVAGNGDATFTWQGAERATWYNVWVGTTDFDERFFDWMLAENLGCENAETCTLTAGTEVSVGGTFNLSLSSGEYVWYVRSWGPGGFSTGGDFDPPLDVWKQGPNILVP